jgi:hypothetical protein
MDFRHRIAPLPLIDVLPTTTIPRRFPVSVVSVSNANPGANDYLTTISTQDLIDQGQPMATHQSKAQKETVERVMHEFKHGELNTSRGRKVKNPKQAIAIGLHEAGASKYEKQGGEPAESKTCQSSRAAWCDREGPQRGRERAGT